MAPIGHNSKKIRWSPRATDGNHVRICAINVNSIRANKRRYDLQKFIRTHNIDIALLSETKISSIHNPSFVNHHLIRTDRSKTGRGGGTAILINKKLQFSTISHPNSARNQILEYTAIKIKLNSKGSLITFSVYAPYSTSNRFLEEWNSLFIDFNLNNQDTYFIIAGDINARHTLYGDSQTNYRGRQLVHWDAEFSSSLKATIYPAAEPTFPDSGSYLDYGIADSRIELSDLCNGKLKVLPYDSDHNAILLTVSTSSFPEGFCGPPAPATVANYRKVNWERFKEYLEEKTAQEPCIPYNQNLTIEELDNAVKKMEDIILDAIDIIVPKNTAARDYLNYYVNNRTKKLHYYKSKLLTIMFSIRHNRSARNPRGLLQAIKSLIKQANAQLHREFRKSVTAYWEAKQRAINYRDPSAFFPDINRLLRRKRLPKIENLRISKESPNFATPGMINTDHLAEIGNDYLITEPIDKLNVIGKHFEIVNSPRYTNTTSTTKSAADRVAQNILNTITTNRTQSRTITTFSVDNPAFNPTHDHPQTRTFFDRYESAALFRRANNKTSSGLDGIPMIVLKHLPINLILDYTTIFNNAVNQSYYPVRWKRAKVIPIQKKDKLSSDPTSYRPISLTCNISKIFEKLIKRSLLDHINSNGIIPDNQFGFRARHSTIHAINKFASDLNNYLLNGKLVGAVLIDLEKAFDSVWLNGLTYKLVQLGFPSHLTALITDMIHGKSFVTWDGANTSTYIFKITEGLQQGTVTSPILFNIFNAEVINAFNLNSGNNTHSIAYADDLVIYAADTDPDSIQQKLNDLVNQVNSYYLDWNLRINPAKSEAILFRKTVNQIPFYTVKKLKNFKINISDPGSNESIAIPTKNLVKYLGIKFDYLIRMNDHHTSQLKKARNALKANARIFHNRNLERKAKIICYQLLVRPIISYAAPIWWNTGPSVMEQYRKFERACLRACLGTYRSAHSNYRKRTSNRSIYNSAKIPRFDTFTLTLTRNYFSTLYSINNRILDELKVNNPANINRMMASGYTSPELFTHLDKRGYIQNEDNIPIIYHIKRHRANKSIDPKADRLTRNNQIYSTMLPDGDHASLSRLSKAYWWLQQDARHIDEIRRRSIR